MICEAWTIVVVPFPFSDSPHVKFRPAVVLSTRGFNRCGLTIMAMVTSARHSKMPGDIPIKPGTAGLSTDCIIRMKLFTLDNRLIRDKLGVLPEETGGQLDRTLHSILHGPE
ncbi:MAG: type II toxin-antitoxin system PemK/MazF family toxin [Bryobacterales bacterium]|nr:type II toxin-antitoxin system PemK/MazF family toxin [Bryobacterales bacterium]MBV9399095.1 type II toxin-antitoxin system PemK/MazF family toxin [Bryobacterales bacterium]